MPRVTAFGSRSYMRVSVTRAGATLTALSLAFRPSIDRGRKALFSFTDGANVYDLEVEFHDDAFEEFTVTGQKKGP